MKGLKNMSSNTGNKLNKDIKNNMKLTKRVLARELAVSDWIGEKMSKILTDTANILKGKPKPLTIHSWHDLPLIAKRLMRKIK